MALDPYAVYADLADLKSEIGETGTTNDVLLTRHLADASRVWDRLCEAPDGYFAGEAAGAIRYLDVTDEDSATYRVAIPAAMAITAVAVDETGDRTYDTTWSSSTDYRLYPLDGPPYTEIRVDRTNGRYALPVGDARLKLTGTFGMSATVPAPVQRAVRLLANRYRVRPNTPEALQAGTNNMMAFGKHDPDVLTIMRDGRYRMPEVFA